MRDDDGMSDTHVKTEARSVVLSWTVEGEVRADIIKLCDSEQHSEQWTNEVIKPLYTRPYQPVLPWKHQPVPTVDNSTDLLHYRRHPPHVCSEHQDSSPNYQTTQTFASSSCPSRSLIIMLSITNPLIFSSHPPRCHQGIVGTKHG
ncbi:hypothetical protein C0Q70_06517 [Pomacea canaliculata]|uniref:Uncharacterized protein n=1 Tax=Pomacea canaliculata TaxID=400727 RepID=A0A2T7PP78_POMCA|nr:hypothetical protein C0Q70_06517 [Pomacea canaliculata]